MLNSFVGMGRLTYQPELKTTASGMSVLHFQVAIDRNYTPEGQERKADFIDCTAWRQTAEFIARNFNKGQMIAIEGSLQTDNYEKNGEKRKAVAVIVSQAHFCGSKESPGTTDVEEIETEEMPF